jgi:outer membrane protein insertion porin family
MLKRVLPLLSLFVLSLTVNAQTVIGGDTTTIDYSNPKEYRIGGVTVTGAEHLDKNVLIMLSGFVVGDKITLPSEKISEAIKNLWKQGLFADVAISITKITADNVFLDIHVEERPRLSKFSFKGIRKHEADDLRDKIKLMKGKVVTDNLILTTQNKIKEHFVDNGFLNAEVDVRQRNDSSQQNSVILLIDIKKHKKVKIKDIIIEGNTALKAGKLRRAMKDTKQKRWYTIFNSSKYLEENFEKDKEKLLAKYYAKGYRDAKIVRDSVYPAEKKNRLNILISIEEGHKYYFRNISWLGNTKHSSAELSNVLGIKKGDVFDQTKLETRLMMNQDGRDVSSLYMDDGYLFFQVNPVEVLVENDSIDYEMRIYEGKQARINKVTVIGNTKTNDRVIMREIRTKPGQLFSRADIIRTQRELAQLRYFNPEKLAVNPTPNPAEGTVDIEYTVEESPSDQLELSGGWGGGRVVGTLGVSFNNFSARNLFKGSAWRPLPAGDGQSLTLRAQSNGLYYQSVNGSFVEPWLGGKKPNSLSVSSYYSVFSNGEKASSGNQRSLKIIGTSVGLGKRLKVPDDFFTLYQDVSYQHYIVNNYAAFYIFNKGKSNNLSYRFNLSRNSIDQPIFPKTGSQVTFSVQLTPPYSLFKEDSIGGKPDYSVMTTQDKYRWIEYHKWKFTTQWFTPIVGKTRPLVLMAKAGFGFLGYYNKNLGAPPFERFYLGGSGLTGYSQLDGREIIALRGYSDGKMSPDVGAAYITKYTAELRYPVSLNPSATVYGLAFVEAGNSWETFKNYNPFDVKRSTGVGVRVYLPMFGLLGLDYGWRLDDSPYDLRMEKSQFHFTIGANIGDL